MFHRGNMFIVCAGAILKGSTCLLRHITTENGFCVNTLKSSKNWIAINNPFVERDQVTFGSKTIAMIL